MASVTATSGIKVKFTAYCRGEPGEDANTLRQRMIVAGVPLHRQGIPEQCPYDPDRIRVPYITSEN